MTQPDFTGLSLTDLFGLQSKLKERMSDLATQTEMAASKEEGEPFATKWIQNFPLHDALKEEIEIRLTARNIIIQ